MAGDPRKGEEYVRLSKTRLLPADLEDHTPIAETEPSLLHRSLLELPHKVESASGSFLHLSDGRNILDACTGAAVAIIGHGVIEIAQATFAQMSKVSYIHTGQYRTDSSEELAACILEPREEDGFFDHGLKKAFFVGSGSEANDTALKCSRQYWFEKGEPQRKWYIARRQAYHGNTIGAMSISDLRARKVPYQDILTTNVSFVGAADAYHRRENTETEDDFVTRLIQEIEDEILRLGPENVISFIGETVSGAALGAMPAPKGYWPAVRDLCDKYNVLLHLDEIMCGIGRMGTYFAFTQEGIRPDVVTVGKGLGGGYAPIAGMLINERIVDGLRQGTSVFNHGHTYQAHPVTCATAMAVQTIVKRDRLVSRCAVQGEKLEQLLRRTFENCEHVGDIRGYGLFWAVEFMQDKAAKIPFPREMTFGARVQLAAFDMGVAVYPGAGTVNGWEGDHVLLAPPYTASDEELVLAVSVLEKAYHETVRNQLGAKI